jgi:hypothetical protein
MLAIVAPLAFVYFYVLRNWLARWGATEAEQHRHLPGDDLVAEPQWGFTQAITINAPVSQVWPWIVQLGQGRAGFYTYESLENLAGSNIHNADRIVPEWQNLKLGDEVKIFEDGGFVVRDMQLERYLVLHGRVDLETGKGNQFDAPMPEKFMEATLGWFLEPLSDQYTRLISHSNMNYSGQLVNELTYGEPMKVGSFIMDRGMLEGIKKRAEALYQQEIQ